eukprot:362918-Chlamydomonas_euryale.AAC.1
MNSPNHASWFRLQVQLSGLGFSFHVRLNPGTASALKALRWRWCREELHVKENMCAYLEQDPTAAQRQAC